MKIYFAHSRHSNFHLDFYQPIRESALNAEHEFIFPHESAKEEKTKDIIQNADLVIAEVSLPGTGLGVEIGWADAFDKPLLLLYKSGAQVSNSLKYVSGTRVEYTDHEDMIAKIAAHISKQS